MIRLISFLLLLSALTNNVQCQQSDFKHIDFKIAEGKALQMKGRELYNVPLLVHNLTYNLKTDVEQFKAIYLWICQNIENDHSLMQKNDHMWLKHKNDAKKLDLWNTKFKKEVFTKLLKDKKTLCSGYSYLIKKFSNLAGIECEIINGYGKLSSSLKKLETPNHSWNAVKLNNKWYLCDATWSSGYINSKGLFIFDYNDSFFLMDPKEFSNSHKPLNQNLF